MSTNNYISFKKITLASGQTIQNWLDDFYYPNIASMPTYARFTFYDASGAIVGEYINDKIVINGVNEAELLTKEDKVNKVTTLAGANNTTYPTTLLMSTELGKKQNTLVSGTNIKTIQGQSVLGSDNIEISFSNIAGNITIEDATGTGNAITGLTASGSAITPTKGTTFVVASAKGETANKSLGFGSTFKVLQIGATGTVNERTMTLPSETTLGRTESGTGNVVGDVTISGNTITVEKTEVADKTWVAENTRSNTWVPAFTDLPTGTGADKVAIGNHTHGNITSLGAIGTVSGRLIETTANGVLNVKAPGTTSQYLRGDNTWQPLTLDVVADGTSRKLANYELLTNKQTTGTLSNSTTQYPSTAIVKSYIDTNITSVQNDIDTIELDIDDIETSLSFKVDEALNDGKMYARQYENWTALESGASLRNSLCWRDSCEGEIYIPEEVIDGGSI